jgi:hypothetical protein
MRIGLLEPWQNTTDKTRYFLKKSVAESLVQKGHAVWVTPRRVRKVDIGWVPITPRATRAPKQLGFAVYKWQP